MDRRAELVTCWSLGLILFQLLSIIVVIEERRFIYCSGVFFLFPFFYLLLVFAIVVTDPALFHHELEI